jgi:uncharacterized membrane protein
MPDNKPKLTIESDAEEPKGSAGGGAADRHEGTAKAASAFSHARSATTHWLSNNFPGHENAVFGGICGLIVAVLVFAIGFWQTLFVVICVLIGVAIGQYLDGNPTVVKAFRRMFGGGGE